MTAETLPEISIFMSLVQKTGLKSQIKPEDTITLIAPSNQVFECESIDYKFLRDFYLIDYLEHHFFSGNIIDALKEKKSDLPLKSRSSDPLTNYFYHHSKEKRVWARLSSDHFIHFHSKIGGYVASNRVIPAGDGLIVIVDQFFYRHLLLRKQAKGGHLFSSLVGQANKKEDAVR